MKKISAGLLLLLLANLSDAQNENRIPAEHIQESMYDDKGQLSFVGFTSASAITPDKVAAFINTSVLNGAASVVLSATERDREGYTHQRYNISLNGAVLANRAIVAHIKGNRLVSLNGDLVSIGKPANSAIIGEQEALAAALKKVGAERYKWQDAAEERHMKEVFNDPSFSYYPKGEKVLYEEKGQLKYAWRFNVYADVPLYRANVYVDAATAAILAEENLICTFDVPGTAVTKYSGTQTITCDQTAPSTYRLRESGRGNGVETYNKNYSTSTANATDFTNGSSTWNLAGLDQGALDAHWGAEKTYDYLFTQHNRNSIDNAGFKLVSYVHHGSNYANAFWNGQVMTYGDGNSSYGIFTTLDICGHEITHGLTSKTANLTYSYESGALNESFSDIFATAIENYGRPSNWNWLIGEDLNNSALRSMSNPNQYWQPDTYQGSNWYTGTGDNGGVHTNSGVSNFWFYLLVNGGFGTNDISQAYSVTGIGMTKAAKIAFRALTVYFTPSTNFANARLLTIQAAKDLYGACSNEVIQTANAWHAVGVGAQYSAASAGANFYAFSTNYCSVPATVSFSNTTVNGQSYSWDFGDGSSTVTTVNASHTYTAAGSYKVRLFVNGCSGLDSVSRPGYITVGVPSMPVVSDVTGCVNSTVSLNASGNAAILWYESSSSPTVLSSGNQYNTPLLAGSTTYYVANTFTTPVMLGGMTSTVGGPFLNNNSQYLEFDVYQNSVLNSVVVVAQIAGNRTFQLRNSANTVLSSITLSLNVGTNTVNLNFALSPGLKYRLGLSNSSLSLLQRTSVGVNYPYNLGSAVKIISSSAGATGYIYFYDWVVNIAGCSSPRIPVNVSLHPLPDVWLTAPDTMVCMHDEVVLDIYPPGGTLSGNAIVSGNSFNASASGPGTYQVDYFYTDTNGCSNSKTIMMYADLCTGFSKDLDLSDVSVYPNPASDVIVVRSPFAGKGKVSVSDASGRLVADVRITSEEERISLQHLAKGIYLLRISEGDSHVKTIKVIRE